MNEVLHVAQAIVAYAPVILNHLGMGLIVLLTFFVTMTLQSPETVATLCLLMALYISYCISRPVRRVLRWYLIWPLGRLYYRLVRRPIRLMMGRVMASWKKSIVADRIDDLLMKLCYEEHILSKQDYRRMSSAIGKTLGLEDLISRKLHPVGVKKRIKENVSESQAARESIFSKLPAPPTQVKADPKYDPKGGTNLVFLRRRNSAA